MTAKKPAAPPKAKPPAVDYVDIPIILFVDKDGGHEAWGHSHYDPFKNPNECMSGDFDEGGGTYIRIVVRVPKSRLKLDTVTFVMAE